MNPSDAPIAGETGGDAPAAALPDIPPTPQVWHVPTSFWVWLVILAATYIVPPLLAGRGAAQVENKGLNTATFAALGQAEYQTRIALAPGLSPKTGGAGVGKPSVPAKDPAETAAKTAAKSFRNIAQSGDGVVSARKVFVLEHLLKQPLDDKLLTGTLAQNLQKRGAKAGEIGTELAFWRFLYGTSGGITDADAAVKRVRTYNLGLLEEQAVADIYDRANRPKDAKRTLDTLHKKVTVQLLRLAAVAVVLVCAGLTGIVFLAIFVSAAVRKAWHKVGRLRVEGTLPGTTPDGGALLDIFVAYLALVRGVGLAAGFLPGLDAVSPVFLSAGVYVGTGILAGAYLHFQARQGGWNLSAIGLRRVKGVEIWYGVAGYCAALPLTILLGSLNQQMFKDSQSSLTPNPVLPMIAGEGSDVGRIVLFVLVALAAPIFEELFFRGVLYSALKTRFPTLTCVLISAACFAVVHPVGDWLPIFGLGCLLGTVREMRQSIVPGIAVHFCQNAMAFTLMSAMFGR